MSYTDLMRLDLGSSENKVSIIPHITFGIKDGNFLIDGIVKYHNPYITIDYANNLVLTSKNPSNYNIWISENDTTLKLLICLADNIIIKDRYVILFIGDCSKVITVNETIPEYIECMKTRSCTIELDNVKLIVVNHPNDFSNYVYQIG